MKFGDTLQERSVPQWVHYNIDYDNLKQLIKDYTTNEKTQPRCIPGQGTKAETLKRLEDHFYEQLQKEHENTDLFVRSKAGEIDRKIADLERRLESLKQRCLPLSSSKQSMRCIERFSRLEDEALAHGQELQNLDRFVVVNRQGLRKILKKYRKWTDSPDLERRFQKHVLDRATSFTNRNFLSSLANYNRVLADIRIAGSPDERSDQYTRSLVENERTACTNPGSLSMIFDQGSDAEIDTAISVLPLGNSAKTACYWIHSENLLQLQVLLLRHARSRRNQLSSSTPIQRSPHPSRRGSTSESGSAAAVVSGTEARLIVCDDLSAFAERCNSAVINDSGTTACTSIQNGATSVRLSSSDDAIIVIDAALKADIRRNKSQGQPGFQTVKVKRKALRRLFDANATIDAINSQGEINGVAGGTLTPGTKVAGTGLKSTSDVGTIKRWLTANEQIQPLLELCFHRCRYIGTHNTANSGLWATLDTEVTMAKSTSLSLDKYDLSESSNEANSATHKFPYAVLSIRVEGQRSTSLIGELDDSHLTERVRGFSLAIHAIATLYKPHNMSSPYWLPLLEQDIRKAPRSIETCRRRDPRSTPQSGSTRPTSVSTGSGQGLPNGPFTPRLQSSETSTPDNSESSNTAIGRQKRKMRRERPLTKAVYEASPQRKRRYWNEFDDGEEMPDNEAYTVYVDPDASSFPGAALVSRLNDAIRSSARKLKSRSWHGNSTAEEREALVNNERSISRSSTASSDTENGKPGGTSLSHNRYRRSSTLLERVFPRDNIRDAWLLASIASYILSCVLLFLSVILVTTGRRKAVAETDAGVLVGAAFSLALGVFGLVGFAIRTRRFTCIWLTVASILFIAIIIGNSVLLVHVL